MKNPLFFSLLLVFFSMSSKAQWSTQATGFDEPRGLWDMSIVSDKIVWAIAYDADIGFLILVPEFTRTIDGGETWVTGDFPPGYWWSNICAIDASTAWVSVNNEDDRLDGAIFKTTNGGETWDEQGKNEIYNSTSFVNVVHFWNANEGVAIGDPNTAEFEIYTTTDGGAHWISVLGSEIPDPLSEEIGISRNYAVYGNHIWFSTNKARVFHSPDKGHTWSSGSTGIIPGSAIDIDIAFWNENDGIARRYKYTSQANVGVATTHDGGSTWSLIHPEGTMFGNNSGNIAYVPGTTSTLVTTGNASWHPGSSYSNDGGLTWITIDSIIPMYISRFWDNMTGWSAGENSDNVTGGIFKYEGNLVGTKNPETGKEITMNISPNPSDGLFTIRLMNGLNDNLKISVYDMNGILVFKNYSGDPGEFFMHTIDLRSLLSGLYILKIENGNFQHIQKIMIQQ